MAHQAEKTGSTPFYQALENLQLDLIRRTVAVIGDPRPESKVILENNIRTMDHLSEAIQTAKNAHSYAAGLSLRTL